MTDTERDEPRIEDLIYDGNREAGDLVKPSQPVEFDDDELVSLDYSQPAGHLIADASGKFVGGA